ncbi:MAG: hypothetical protein IPG55_00655 [Saprospiraceae bacterium]|nr:hypothetical protein [Candidatus Defluviibacterium haderslevense]MBK7243795.1 hypothetical protein [Candidatus Defluviibacterium haderslevense]
MKRNFLLFCIYLWSPFILVCQKKIFPSLRAGQVQVSSEFGFSNLLGDFRSNKIFAAPGHNFGLHIDKMWNKIGIGLYVGYDKNDIDYPDLFSGGNSGLYISKSMDVPQNIWQQFSIGIGPNYKLDISKKFNIDITAKLGIAKITYQDHGQFYDIDDIQNNGYLLYQTKNETIEKKLNLILYSALRLNYKASKKINLSLSGNFKNVKNVLHSYSYLKGNFNPMMTNEGFLKAIVTASTVTEISKCNFNSFGLNLGLSYTFGVDKNKTKPPIDTSNVTNQSDYYE